MRPLETSRLVTIACGGTGGHLFPGMAIAEALQRQSCDVTLLVSAKEVDQHGVRSAPGLEIETLPAVALQKGSLTAFLRGFWNSYRICLRLFARRRPDAVLAMGGFTSAPPILAGRARGAATFVHESNAIPGRANRWLSFVVDEVFVGFSTAARRLFTQAVRFTGTPIRPQFEPSDAASCRMALGLDPNRPVLLATGGSQGAHGINELIRHALPIFAARAPDLQFIHLTGSNDKTAIESAYQAHGSRALIRAFLTEMELALGAATLAVGRSGASFLAELAAMRVPSVLIPYPRAVDNHQLLNARALAETGAAKCLDEGNATPEFLAQLVLALIESDSARESMSRALERWCFPSAADRIAERVLDTILTRESGREPAGTSAARTETEVLDVGKVPAIPDPPANRDFRTRTEARAIKFGHVSGKLRDTKVRLR